MRRRVIVEALEERSLFSIGAIVISGPLTTGFQYQFHTLQNGVEVSTGTHIVIGPATFNGNSAIEVDDIVKTGKSTGTLAQFERLDPSIGLEEFGGTITNTKLVQTDTFTPAEIDAPPILDAGVTYNFSWTDSTDVGGGTTSDSTVQYHIKLLSDTTEQIKVPGGTFACYHLQTSQTDKSSGSPPSVSNADVWCAPGIGLVKAVTNSSTVELTKFTFKLVSSLQFGVQPSNSIVKIPIAPAVTVNILDAQGMPDTKNTSTVTLSVLTGPTGAVLGGTTSVAAVKGVATFGNLMLNTPGSYTLVAKDGNLLAADSFKFTVSPPLVPTKLAFASPQPTTGIAGAKLSPKITVNVEASSGAVVTTDRSKVTVAITSGPVGATLGGTHVMQAINGVATFTNLNFPVAGTYTLTATDGALASALSKTITITAAAATKLVFDKQPRTVTAGAKFLPAPTVKVEDAFGNIVTTNKSTVTIAASSLPKGGAILGTLTAQAVKGIATFGNLSAKIAGAYVLKATDSLLAAGISRSITIIAAAAKQLAIGTQPTSVDAGSVFKPALAVKVEDAFGNVVTTDSSAVAIALASNPAAGVLTGTLVINAVKGIATFSNLLIKRAGIYTIKATDGALTPAVTKPITITPGAAAKLVVTQQPTTGTAGAKLAPAFFVKVEDKFGNVDTTDKSKVSISIATGPAGGALGGKQSLLATAGVAKFTNLSILAAGDYTLKVTDGKLTPAVTKDVVIT